MGFNNGGNNNPRCCCLNRKPKFSVKLSTCQFGGKRCTGSTIPAGSAASSCPSTRHGNPASTSAEQICCSTATENACGTAKHGATAESCTESTKFCATGDDDASTKHGVQPASTGCHDATTTAATPIYHDPSCTTANAAG